MKPGLTFYTELKWLKLLSIGLAEIVQGNLPEREDAKNEP